MTDGLTRANETQTGWERLQIGWKSNSSIFSISWQQYRMCLFISLICVFKFLNGLRKIIWVLNILSMAFHNCFEWTFGLYNNSPIYYSHCCTLNINQKQMRERFPNSTKIGYLNSGGTLIDTFFNILRFFLKWLLQFHCNILWWSRNINSRHLFEHISWNTDYDKGLYVRKGLELSTNSPFLFTEISIDWYVHLRILFYERPNWN